MMLPPLYRYITSGGCLASGRLPPFPNESLAQPRINGSCPLTRNPLQNHLQGVKCHPGNASDTSTAMIQISAQKKAVHKYCRPLKKAARTKPPIPSANNKR